METASYLLGRDGRSDRSCLPVAEAPGHFSRYSARRLRGILVDSEFSVMSVRYRSTFLVSTAVLLSTLPYRLAGRHATDQVLNDIGECLNPGAGANRLVRCRLAMEASVARRVSVLTLGQKRR
jgi:hypothetical protein